MKRLVGSSFAVLVLAGLCLLAAPAGAQSQTGPEVVYDIFHDTSLPIREYPGVAATAPARRVRPLPRRILPGAGLTQTDAVEQVFALPTVSATISRNFDGVPDSANGLFAFVPPDENLAVGATQVVEVINTAYQVFNKSTGTSVQAPKQISSIFTGVSGLCGQGPTSPNYTDPIVLYDQKAGLGTNVFNDYDKFGVWPDAYYGAYNLFSLGKFQGVKACAYQRSAMLAGRVSRVRSLLQKTDYTPKFKHLAGERLADVGQLSGCCHIRR